MNETGATQSLSLTSMRVCSTVHSNVYGLVNIHCIRYHTMVDSIHSTSPPVQKYHTLTSGSVESHWTPLEGTLVPLGKNQFSLSSPVESV